MENAIKLLENKHMRLKVNKDKSTVKKPNESKFLGYTFWRSHSTSWEYKLGIHKKSYIKFKNRIRQILKRNRGISIEEHIGELNLYLSGW